MQMPLALPQSRRQSIASVVLDRLKTLVVAATDRDTTTDVEPRPYSFLSDCECPEDCLRDHENE